MMLKNRLMPYMPTVKEYEKLLERAKKLLPEETHKLERLELPRPICTVVGNRTILQNFKDICTAINRDQQHVLRFLSREMATASSISGARATFQGKFSEESLKRLLNRYVQEFVTCPVCSRPDTKMEKKERILLLVCEACGAKSPLRII